MNKTLLRGWWIRPFCAALAAAAACTAAAVTEGGLRVDQTQTLGTHNSYHVAPGPVMDALIRQRSPALADSLAYTHRPLREQLERLGMRQLELDLYADPQGGRFAHPLGPSLAAEAGLGMVAGHDPEGRLQSPGFKVLHVPDVDFISRAWSFRAALEEIRDWSATHPAHFPVFVLIELKEDAPGPEFTQPVRLDAGLLSAVDKEIREVLPAGQRFEPDQLRAGRATLREAVAGKGWPLVSELAGRVVFLLDNEGELRDRYLKGNPALEGRAMFVSVPREHPAAAWMKLNNPEAEFEVIQARVREGFLVRTRADADTLEARQGQGARREKALASGAQLVSTDYPEPNPSLSPYAVQLPLGRVARPNPVTAPAGMDPDLEVELVAAQTAEWQDRLGQAAHAERRLAEASRHYAAALKLDPPAEATSAEKARVRRLAPRLRLHPAEPFRLRDLAVILHPDLPWIGYHLFWEDDLDFPEDNDPCDHEVIWVRFDPVTEQAVEVRTYFHGQILRHPLDRGNAVVGVEWGKHGSVPLERGHPVEGALARLQSHWRRLHETGRRLPDHPLGRGWPAIFQGGFEEYVRWEVPLDLAEHGTASRPVLRSRWPNAVLDQWLLPYNFAAKTSWPEVRAPVLP